MINISHQRNINQNHTEILYHTIRIIIVKKDNISADDGVKLTLMVAQGKESTLQCKRHGFDLSDNPWSRNDNPLQ